MSDQSNTTGLHAANLPYPLPDPGYEYRCQRCGHQWRRRRVEDAEPVSCAKCRSAYWRTAAKEGRRVARRGNGKVGKPKRRKMGARKAVKSAAAAVDNASRAPIPTVGLQVPVPEEAREPLPFADLLLTPPPHLQRIRSKQPEQFDGGTEVRDLLLYPPHHLQNEQQPEHAIRKTTAQLPVSQERRGEEGEGGGAEHKAQEADQPEDHPQESTEVPA